MHRGRALLSAASRVCPVRFPRELQLETRGRTSSTRYLSSITRSYWRVPLPCISSLTSPGGRRNCVSCAPQLQTIHAPIRATSCCIMAACTYRATTSAFTLRFSRRPSCVSSFRESKHAPHCTTHPRDMALGGSYLMTAQLRLHFSSSENP